MQLKFSVHSVAVQKVTRIATIDGHDVEVQAPALVVELVNSRLSQTLTFTDIQAASEVFETGGTVLATYSKDEG